MNPEEAIAKLGALTGDDVEGDHVDADKILLAVVPPEVADAYERVQARCGAWWYA